MARAASVCGLCRFDEPQDEPAPKTLGNGHVFQRHGNALFRILRQAQDCVRARAMACWEMARGDLAPSLLHSKNEERLKRDTAGNPGSTGWQTPVPSGVLSQWHGLVKPLICDNSTTRQELFLRQIL